MDVDMKIKDDLDKDKERDYDRDRDRDRERDSKDRDRDCDRRDSARSRRGGGGDHREPEDRERRNDRRRRSRSPRSPSPSRSRRRSASPSRRRSRRSRSRGGSSRSRSRDRKPSEALPRSLGGPINALHEEAVEFAKHSKRENRVYVGNLSYDIKYRDLVEFMRGAGEVLFAEVLVTPTGISKGCGIVEFASQEDSQRAIRELSEQPLLGRPVFIREDRENESRFGATPVPGKIGMAMAGQGLTAGPPPRPAYHNSFGQNPGNQLYVGNLPYQAGWQDLKDLFRSAGNIIRADINIGADGRPKGSGTVIYETAKDGQQAISMYNGFDWYGCILEVHEDRHAGLSGPGGSHDSFCGGLWGFWGGLRGLPYGGCGGYGHGGYAASRLVQDYSGLDQQAGGYARTYDGRYAGEYGGGYDTGGYKSEPSQQIMVHKQCKAWSTTCAQDTLHCEHVHPVRQACLTLSRPPFGQK
ncbi:RNA-binding domain-containing protein [Russula ochroleuca]|uniref:RNA-binding domain-containing protein n=1 Tax=Russula ochroleuca TaxID=152965 RepID=A0A9P5MQV5_9AGAM|nr:RNA-binding domain-containing protein [Russula ochroleuca]